MIPKGRGKFNKEGENIQYFMSPPFLRIINVSERWTSALSMCLLPNMPLVISGWTSQDDSIFGAHALIRLLIDFKNLSCL